ncbi:hypothetical protein BN946_scf184798.g44 [Trametes cinnabarina]|uniref:Uncharacterized protein n=1 Tax=Pycnoporus cinnabarinus TaxID=5643 RepID=A0A060SEM0_PYCCI|nr:hypothetical protein BN946_scf184798.g44 [Trametes cinnabarina]
MPSPIRALSPADSAASYDYFSHSRSASHDGSSKSSGSGSYGTVSDDISSDDDDQIVLSFSDISALEMVSQRGDAPRTPGVFSDDEFVIMSMPTTPREDDLTTSFSALSVSASSARAILQTGTSSTNNSPSSKAARKHAKRKSPVSASPSTGTIASGSNPATAAVPSSSVKTSSKSKKKKAKKAKKAARAAAPAKRASAEGLGERPIVDDVSEAGLEYPTVYVPPAVYESAQSYVSSVIAAAPSTKSSGAKLAFLQALIVELGLYPSQSTLTASSSSPSSFFSLPSLPSSMRAAKALLKSHVFLNVRDYLAVRTQGIDALRRVMHPNRTALMREIRGGKRTPVKVVKESGLSVLLVTCYR